MAISRSLRYQILRRDNHTCRYCGRTPPEVRLTVDHVAPAALGGRDEPGNLVTACSDCNAGKAATPPDAEQVASVSEDALRWAQALKAAAAQMLADHAARQADRDAFEEAWLRWGRGEGDKRRSMALPPDWPQAVDRFRAAGLPIEILLECIPPAMTRPKVVDDKRFNYVCGVAWNKITELQEAGKILLAGAERDVPEADDFRDGQRALARHLLQMGFLDEEQGRFRRLAQDRFNEEWNGNDDPEVEALDVAISSQSADIFSLRTALTTIIACVPPEQRHRCEKAAWRELEKSEQSEPSDIRFECATGRQLAAELGTAFLSTLPDDERKAWIACGLTHRDTEVVNYLVLVDAARYAQGFKQGDPFLYGMCAANDGTTMCPNRATFEVSFTDCTCGGERCKGHRCWCESHMQDAIDGTLRRADTGSPFQIGDFDTFNPDDPWSRGSTAPTTTTEDS